MSGVVRTPPETKVVVEQIDRTFGGIDHFWYDVARLERSKDELYEIIGEVIDDDIYNLRNCTQQGDVWVDAGCHVGLFSIAAMMAGADVSVMYDMDAEMAWCAEANARSFLMQQLVRDYRPRIRTIAINTKLDRPDTLVAAAMQTKEVWQDFGKRACLKLDIQGSEQNIIALNGARALSEAFDMMVLEWHFPDDIQWLSEELERGGWRIDAMKQHEDILLGTKTYIVWATTG